MIIDALKLQGDIVRLFLATTVTKGALEASNRYGIKW
ncbi:hypothetical protein SJAV_01280 [Sulfurisphaera javensis]|uniref:Uncharacterized protein n=1 Tax=Sulfurisphaera javensis TaxID=2049879 RepID=A0AAT9GMR2_9CREN